MWNVFNKKGLNKGCKNNICKTLKGAILHSFVGERQVVTLKQNIEVRSYLNFPITVKIIKPKGKPRLSSFDSKHSLKSNKYTLIYTDRAKQQSFMFEKSKQIILATSEYSKNSLSVNRKHHLKTKICSSEVSTSPCSEHVEINYHQNTIPCIF